MSQQKIDISGDCELNDDMQRRIEDLAFFKKLKELSFVHEIWLYGSRARGDNADRSDIDIAIYCPEASDVQWLSVVSIIDEADTLLKIDCVRLESLKDTNPLKENILSQGICLYKSYGKL